MDTELILPYQDINIDDITLIELTEDTLEDVTSYIEATRHIQEIHQLFKLFQYNLRRLFHVYELNNNDTICRNISVFENFTDQIELNALVINYISSGKTLIDSLTTCVKNTCSDMEPNYETFCKFLSNKYDGCFSYRLLTRLRDFSQHGHLPVSVRNNSICFDIAQITHTPHFNHNKSLLKEMEYFNEELLITNQTMPHYVFTLAIAEYTSSMAEIYREFWYTIHPSFINIEKKLRTFLDQNPECIIHNNKELNGFLFYFLNDTIHIFNTHENSLSMVTGYFEEAKQNYDHEIKEFNEFRKSIKTIKLKPNSN